MNKWDDIPCSWAETFNVKSNVKCQLSPNAIKIKSQQGFLYKLTCWFKNYLKVWKTQNYQNNFSKADQGWKIYLIWFQDLLYIYNNQNSVKWHKEFDGTEQSPEIDLPIYSQMIFDKGRKLSDFDK